MYQSDSSVEKNKSSVQEAARTAITPEAILKAVDDQRMKLRHDRIVGPREFQAAPQQHQVVGLDIMRQRLDLAEHPGEVSI